MTEPNTLVTLAQILKPGRYVALPVTTSSDSDNTPVPSYEAYCHWAARMPNGDVITGSYGPAAAADGSEINLVAERMCDYMRGVLSGLMEDACAEDEEADESPITPEDETEEEASEAPKKVAAPKKAAAKKAAAKKVAKPAPAPMPAPEVAPEPTPVPRAPEPVAAPAPLQEPVPEPQEPAHEPIPNSAGEHVITYGRHTGKRLKEVTRAAVEWYAKDFAPTNPSPNDAALIGAARSYLVELVNADNP